MSLTSLMMFIASPISLTTNIPEAITILIVSDSNYNFPLLY